MLINIIEIFMSLILIYLVISGVYQIFLAVSYFITRNKTDSAQAKLNKFAIIVPAHNEELLIANFCQSILAVDYKKSDYDVYVIADNCNDKTADICSEYSINVLSRTDINKRGKGYALEWALERISINAYDAVLVLDADTTVNKSILIELNKMLNSGEQAIQCYIDVPNRHETWFTQLIYLSRTINDLLYHSAKNKLGLSSYLMGTGMCFHKTLLEKMKWGAYSLSEDWEYYAKLIEQGYRVAFAEKAIIRQMETNSLSQATTQRLRWASGRFYVVKNLGLSLLIKG
ncbi:MAG: glycosyltransferase, partial [Gammaproteobacteria bacterium]|nr:glycosyltransferase [Gammaproteobacteria bacterium]